ncbi:MAG: hypothetical protein SGPRY_001605 [Prymnesium sp.]
MFLFDFGSKDSPLSSPDRSPSNASPLSPRSATLKGHKLSPVATRCTIRCASENNLAAIDNSQTLHLPVCTSSEPEHLGINIVPPSERGLQKDAIVVPTDSKGAPPAVPTVDPVSNIHIDEHIKTDEEALSLARKIACSTGLETLNLPYCRLGPKLDTLIRNISAGRLTFNNLLPNLRSLNLCANGMTDQSLSQLATALQLSGLPQLSNLDISSNRITTLEPLAQAAQGCPLSLKLSSIKAEHCDLHDESLDALCDAVLAGRLPHLHTLWLGNNLLGDHSLKVSACMHKPHSTAGLAAA